MWRHPPSGDILSEHAHRHARARDGTAIGTYLLPGEFQFVAVLQHNFFTDDFPALSTREFGLALIHDAMRGRTVAIQEETLGSISSRTAEAGENITICRGE